MRFAGVKLFLSTLRGHSIGNQTLQSSLDGLWVFVQTGLPIRLAGLAGAAGPARPGGGWEANARARSITGLAGACPLGRERFLSPSSELRVAHAW